MRSIEIYIDLHQYCFEKLNDLLKSIEITMNHHRIKIIKESNSLEIFKHRYRSTIIKDLSKISEIF